MSDKCTLESRQWLISGNGQAFSLVKRENNQIDVCVADDSKYLFSIDGAFETDLDAGKLSAELRHAFAEQKRALSQDYHISVVSWFVTDAHGRPRDLQANFPFKNRTLPIQRT